MGEFQVFFVSDDSIRHDNCQGANQWFDSDHTNLKIGGTWGYTGSQNDELSSAMCWLKTA